MENNILFWIYSQWNINCISIYIISSLFISQWTFRLLLCLDYCKQRCTDHWGICIFFNYSFIFPGGSSEQNPPINAGEACVITESGRCSGEGNDNPLQYSCLGSSIDRRSWLGTVHEVTRVTHDLATKQQTVPKNRIAITLFLEDVVYTHTHTHTQKYYSGIENNEIMLFAQ